MVSTSRHFTHGGSLDVTSDVQPHSEETTSPSFDITRDSTKYPESKLTEKRREHKKEFKPTMLSLRPSAAAQLPEEQQDMAEENQSLHPGDAEPIPENWNKLSGEKPSLHPGDAISFPEKQEEMTKKDTSLHPGDATQHPEKFRWQDEALPQNANFATMGDQTYEAENQRTKMCSCPPGPEHQTFGMPMPSCPYTQMCTGPYFQNPYDFQPCVVRLRLEPGYQDNAFRLNKYQNLQGNYCQCQKYQ